jgi:hypothetical protein
MNASTGHGAVVECRAWLHPAVVARVLERLFPSMKWLTIDKLATCASKKRPVSNTRALIQLPFDIVRPYR